MSKRDIARIIRAKRKAHTNKIGLHCIERRGLRIHRNQPRGRGPRDPILKRLKRLHRLIGTAIHLWHFRQRLAVAISGSGIATFLSLHRVEIVRTLGRTSTGPKPFEKRTETMGLQEVCKRVLGDLAKDHVLNRNRQVAIFLQSHQDAR